MLLEPITLVAEETAELEDDSEKAEDTGALLELTWLLPGDSELPGVIPDPLEFTTVLVELPGVPLLTGLPDEEEPAVTHSHAENAAPSVLQFCAPLLPSLQVQGTLSPGVHAVVPLVLLGPHALAANRSTMASMDGAGRAARSAASRGTQDIVSPLEMPATMLSQRLKCGVA